MVKKTDSQRVLVVGAGMAGLSLAALLAKAGVPVTVIDREDPHHMASETFDSRTVALSAGTRDVLAPLGIWDQLVPFATAITAIDVQEGHDPFILNFDSAAAKTEAFGWIFPNSVIRRILWQTAQKYHVGYVQGVVKDVAATSTAVTITLRDGRMVTGSVVLGADGRQSRMRALLGVDTVVLDYKQTALVGLITHEKPHNGLALERFYTDGPFAALPFMDDAQGRHRSAIVWTRHGKTPVITDPEALTPLLQAMLDERYGTARAVREWAAYPLGLVHAKTMIGERCALLSDAAHAMHPIAGQGLNLGMRDVGWLGQHLAAAYAAGQDLGATDLLTAYQRARRFDVMTLMAATDILNRLFGIKAAPIRWVRSAGLGLVQKLPPLKRFFMNTAMGQ